ncbi:MAG: hypothetical protein MUC63_00435 [Planctomycetes bacterium]|jgi:hypothetical protein|nr:hypothetical protein [Planctomycetota bacterium]
MRKTMLLGMAFLALAWSGANAAETADYEVHEWGFVAANAPSDPNALQAFLDSLPGNVRQMTLSVPNRPVPVEGPGSNRPAVRPIVPGQTSGPVANPQDPGRTPNPGTPVQNGGAGIEGALPLFRFDPFVWFHSAKPLSVQLRVNLGVNTPLCWWPQGADDGTSISWKRLNLTPRAPEDKRLEEFGKDGSEFTGLAANAREVNASFVGAGNKVEKFLMYDFLGLAWTDLRIRKDSTGLVVSNRGPRAIRELFVFDGKTPEGKALYASQVRAYEKGCRLDTNAEGYWNLVDFRIRMVKCLVDAGLYLDEALCMVRGICAQEAFFRSGGVKAIHLLDADEIDAVSRLELDPKPARVKRVWVMMLWNASDYDGLGRLFDDEKSLARLQEAIRRSGASKEEIARALDRLEIEKERDSAVRSRG